MTMNIHHQLSECCGSCGSEDRLFLHNLRHRGTFRRLCTPCVLHHHSGSFCPICFHVYADHPPPPHQRLMCLHCPSVSHLSCVANPPPPLYQCPPCSDPTYFFFHIRSSLPNKKFKSSDGESAIAPPPPMRAMNKHLAMQLMAAARIASASMNKAASVARVETERRVKEALLARNRAKEALDRVACLVAKQEKEKEKERVSLKSKMDSKPIAEHQKLRIVSVVAQKRIQNQIATAVSGSPKNDSSGSQSNGLHSAKSPKQS